MTPTEFAAWLDGYLTGRDSLDAGQIETIRAKATCVQPEFWRVTVTPPTYPPLRPGTFYDLTTRYSVGTTPYLPHNTVGVAQ